MAEELTTFSLTFDVLLLQRVNLMMNAAADKDTDRYFTNFSFALKLVLPYLSSKTRSAIEQDYKAYEAVVDTIEADKTLNVETKKEKIRKLKQKFADGHNVYIFACFSRIGIVKVKEEGKLDFNVLDIDQMAQIVRGREKGLAKTVEQVVKNGSTK